MVYYIIMKQRFFRFFFIRWISGVVLASLLIPFPAPQALAQVMESFDYSYIISDDDLTDYNSLNLVQIQSFLELKGSSLATYVDPITRLRPAQIIYNSAQDFQLSPKFLLVLIQKEQSLIEQSSPGQYNYDWATGYAVCDGCDVSDPAIQKFKGFYNQVYNAAKRIRTVYLDNLAKNGQTSSGFGPGISKTVDGVIITPENFATAVLFTYTPHLHGNNLFGTIWQKYFARVYPDGTLLNIDGEKEVWLIENGTRRQFANRSVFLSRYTDFSRVLTINRTELTKYPEGRIIQFPNYAYVRTPSGTVYLIVDNTIRGFASREALRKIGVNPEEIVDVTQEDLAGYTEGEAITVQSVYPLGQLIQDTKSGGIYWVQNGIRRPLMSKELMTVNFSGKKFIRRTPEQLSEYALGDPVGFPEGVLVKGSSDPAVYLISNHQRRPFASAEAFEGLGFSWKNIVVTSDSALALHNLGEPLVAPLTN